MTGGYGDGPFMGERFCEKRDDDRKNMTPAEFRRQYEQVWETVHPRQAEILRNNAMLLMSRWKRSADSVYSDECLQHARHCDDEYFKITGERLNLFGVTHT